MIVKYIKNKLLLLGCLCMLATLSIGQNPIISLENALQIARENHAGIEGAKLAVTQQNKLAEAGMLKPVSQIYLSGEEFDFNDQTGVHSINFQQNFNLPKVANAHRNLYQTGANVAEKQLALTDRNVKWQVTNAYYQVIITKQELALANENLKLYENFLQVTTAQMEAGETGKIPSLAARSRLGQARLEMEHAEERFQIARTLFNQWLRSDTNYDVEGVFPKPMAISKDSFANDNPHLQVKQAAIELATAQVKLQEAQLLPQINSGLKLQTANNNFPLFGYQFGVNVPLFKKAYRGKIEAAEIGVKVQESALQESRNKIELTTSELRYRLQHQLHVLDYLQKELAPIVEEQSAVNLSAYREGEIGYLEYLDSLEQAVLVKQQLLTAHYEFNALKLELDYWMGL